LIARGVVTGSLAVLAGMAGAEATFTALGVLNVIFIAATGFGMILIELDDARQRALDADLAKSQFVANMSHELRTPLNAILGFAELLEGRAFSPSPQQASGYASLISQAGRHLLGIINSLLDMAAIEAKREKLKLETVRLDEVVASSVDLLTGEAARKGVALKLDNAGPVEIVSDARALRQILLNLIGNAVKFSPAESVVDIRLVTPGNGRLHLSIADRGPGISTSDFKRIFEPFWQAGDTYSRAYGGVGLGLAIAQRLAEALGGSIAVESRKGEGSTFTIILPLSSEKAGPVAQSPET
jgi:two-component system cell cycle sensor histidine kinase PleC